jgi:hypothetical protein
MGQAVVMGALATCSMGVAPSSLTVLPTPPVLAPAPMASITAMVPFLDVMSFTMCTSMTNPMVIALTAAAFGVPTPAPCIPIPAGPWIPMSPTVMIGGMPALDSASKLMCAWEGVIQIDFPGQVKVQLK